MVRTKVFVGNLSFKTKEPELSAEFSVAGKVIGANIITRGPRSLGYGFVEMESEEAANKAIQLLHHKEVDGREINVEIVKERPEGEEKADRPPREPREPRERKPREPREPREPKEPREPREPKQPREPREPRQPREPKEPRAPRNTDNQSSPSGEGPKKTRTRVYKKREDSEGGSSEPREPRQPREPREPRQPREPREPSERKPREPRAPKPEGEKQERKPRPKRSNAEKTESPTLLFVANLPFALDNETFTKFVTDLSVPFKEAYVVKKHNNRSKGYGFIDFNSTEERASALTKLEGKEIDSRPISVKIALTPSAADSKDANETQEVKSPVKTEKKTEAPKSPAVKDSKPASSPKAAPSPKADAKKDEEPKK